MMRDLKILQDFAELSSRSSSKEQILFSCITHKAINSYIKNLKDDKANAFKTVEGRFKEIYFNRSGCNNGVRKKEWIGSDLCCESR